MPIDVEKFNLEAVLNAIGQAVVLLVCHVLFQAALHGLAVAFLVGLIGFIGLKHKKRFGKPLLVVSSKLLVFCLVLVTPGVISLISTGHLPQAGVFQFSSLGFLFFWGLISLHLSAEEMNFQWF